MSENHNPDFLPTDVTVLPVYWNPNVVPDVEHVTVLGITPAEQRAMVM